MVAMINESYVRKHKRFEVAGSCRDGKAALDFLEQHSVDLLIMDVYMPQIDGFETLRQIRKRQYAVDVIMVTVDYLIKPFTFDRFRMALDKYLAHRDALKDLDTLNQKSVDFIIDSTRRKSEELHPKGIQEQTLQNIVEHMKRYSGAWLTGDEIAQSLGLTSVTVRRYLNYMADAGIAADRMNYSTGGRPCMMYKINS